MSLEVEQKFRVDSFDGVLAELARLGAVGREPIRQVDSYFAHPSRDFPQTDEALRLRRVGETNLITYKGPKLDATTKTRREIELPLADGGPAYESWAEMLEALGFSLVREVAKSRTRFELESDSRRLEVALDEVQGVGVFVEIETSADESDLDAAREAVARVAAALGLTESVRRSYLEMLIENDSGAGG